MWGFDLVFKDIEGVDVGTLCLSSDLDLWTPSLMAGSDTASSLVEWRVV